MGRAPGAAVLAGFAADTKRGALGASRSYYSFAELSAPAERYQHALKLLLEHARAYAGYLYLRSELDLQLMAAIGDAPPPAALERELQARIERAQSLLDSLDDLDEDTKVFDSYPAPPLTHDSPVAPSLLTVPSQPASRFTPPPANDQLAQRVVVLTTRVAGVRKPIGGVILMLEPSASGELDPQLLHAVAEALA